MVRDSLGQKMSKSLGNVIDPLQIINGSTKEVIYLYYECMEKDDVSKWSIKSWIWNKMMLAGPTSGFLFHIFLGLVF